jgi:hypothetical protein
MHAEIPSSADVVAADAVAAPLNVGGRSTIGAASR